MKTFFKILSSVAVLTALAACEAQLPPIVINPDPVFDKSGVYTVNTISIYDTEETVITVSRVYGLSKEVEMVVGIDEALLDEYNALNGTSYQIIPAEYYTIPESVKLEKTAKTIEVPVVIKPKAFVAGVGLDKTGNYVLPISITSSSVELDEQGAQAEVILLPNIVKPAFNVSVPEVNSELSFIKGVPFSQNVVINATSNFTTVEPSKVTFSVDESAVAAFNEANGTDYVLLPEEYYEVQSGVLDMETLNFATTVTFTCHEMESEDIHILPLRMTSSDYQVAQKTPYYVLVQINTLYMWVVNEDGVMVTNTGKGTIGVQLNAPITELQPVDFVVDNDLVASYNAENGTSFKGVDPAKVTILPTSIPVGETSATLSFEVDMADMEYDGADSFLVPLVLKETDLYIGTNVTENTIFVQPKKTLAVDYTKEIWGEEKSNRVMKPIIQVEGITQGFRTSKSDPKQKYCFQYNQVWADGLIYFNILDEAMQDDPNHLKLGNFVDRAYDRATGYDEIQDYGSYIDITTGVLHFDLKVMDNAYKEQGGFPIQVNLTPMN